MTKYQSPVDKSWVSGKFRSGHEATDFGWLKKYNNPNQPIYAISSGRVIYVGYMPNGGNIVTIAHDYNSSHEMWASYQHLSKTNVKVGQVVERGAQIGNMGNTGRSKGEHLHLRMGIIPKGKTFSWGLYNSYKRVNPEGYLFRYPHQEVEGLKALPKEEPKPKPSQTGIKKGDTVQVKASAKKYANVNVTIPAFVKRNKYQVLEVQGNMARLSSINSWVKLSDLTVNGKDVKPVPKPQPTKPKKEYISVGGRHTLYKNSTGTEHYGAANQNLAHRRMEVLERRNGRIRVNAKPFLKPNGDRVFDVDSFWVVL